MSDNQHRYFVINKPRNMVSQFVSSHKVRLLGDLAYSFPEGTHAIGRLDSNSEGLLLLTTNKQITKLLFESEVPHQRSYLVQVRHVVTEETVMKLKTGVSIRIKGGGDYIAAAQEVSIVYDPPVYVQVDDTITEYKPSSWIMITLTEGKFRQVRKMVAAVHHQCKRLIRVSIENMTLDNLQPGDVRELTEEEFCSRLNIKLP